VKRLSKILIALIREPAELTSWFCFCFPGQIGQLLRVLWALIALKSFGRGARLGRGCSVRGPKSISIGECVSFDDFCFSDAESPINSQGHIANDIRIGDDVWLGTNAVILPGVEIGDGCVVGAGAVVTKSFESGLILAGVPARVIGN
jgi:acetyltransferase-like isoleucine patch superfamily enzyme